MSIMPFLYVWDKSMGSSPICAVFHDVCYLAIIIYLVTLRAIPEYASYLSIIIRFIKIPAIIPTASVEIVLNALHARILNTCSSMLNRGVNFLLFVTLCQVGAAYRSWKYATQAIIIILLSLFFWVLLCLALV